MPPSVPSRRPLRPAGLAALALWPALARGGEVEGELSLDTLAARSTSAEEGAGEPAEMTAAELGVRARGRALLADERLELLVDYHGREPLPGDVENSQLRLLYQGEARYALLPDRLTVGAGRFLAPSTILLPVDGVRAEARVGGLTAAAFAGRRGITTSRRNVPFDQLLPAAGASLSGRQPRLQAEVLGAWAEDEAAVSKGAAGEFTEEYGAANAMARFTALPSEPVAFGGQLAFAQQATYVLGPTWADLDLTAQALGLWNGVAWADWRPEGWLRLGYDLQAQRVGVFRAGTDEGGELTEDLEAPSFLDNRGRVTWRPGDRAWLQADARLRIRPEGQERRYGLLGQASIPGIEPLFARAQLQIEDLAYGEDAAGFADRTYWSAAGGWRKGAIDAEIGASFVERSLGPVSTRRDDASSLDSQGEDLAPFVLGAQRIAFARGFFSGRRWFAGLDVEYNLQDPEWRAVVQAGVLGEKAW